jgi:hypothetical protein
MASTFLSDLIYGGTNIQSLFNADRVAAEKAHIGRLGK